uniref:LigA n=1 Tax=Parastrongyloides trichosuri TaxID=131310 RepID=A0A0N5A077_PARTI
MVLRLKARERAVPVVGRDPQRRLYDGAVGRGRAAPARGSRLSRLYPPEADPGGGCAAGGAGGSLCRPAVRQYRTAPRRGSGPSGPREGRADDPQGDGAGADEAGRGQAGKAGPRVHRAARVLGNGGATDPASVRGSLRPDVSAVVAAEGSAEPDGRPVRPRRGRGGGSGEGGAPRRPQDEGLRALSTDARRSGRALGGVVRTGASGAAGDGPLLRAPVQRHAVVDSDAGRGGALGRNAPDLRPARRSITDARRGRGGGFLAHLLRLDLQSGAAAASGDAVGNAQALLEKPAGGRADPGTDRRRVGSHGCHGESAYAHAQRQVPACSRAGGGPRGDG